MLSTHINKLWRTIRITVLQGLKLFAAVWFHHFTQTVPLIWFIRIIWLNIVNKGMYILQIIFCFACVAEWTCWGSLFIILSLLSVLSKSVFSFVNGNFPCKAAYMFYVHNRSCEVFTSLRHLSLSLLSVNFYILISLKPLGQLEPNLIEIFIGYQDKKGQSAHGSKETQHPKL